jgi:phosphoribosylglycinamide formyltransferase 1
MNLAVFASGRGSNFEAIATAVKKGRLKVNLSLLVCDQPKALVLTKAERLKVPAVVIQREECTSRQEFEQRILKQLKDHHIDLIALAGYMRMLSASFVRTYRNRIINIHPALLPSFKGSQSIKDALKYGVKITGVTVHFVDEEMDHGPIILQEALTVGSQESLSSLEARIHILEHRLYPEAIRLVAEKKVRVKGRVVLLS